MRLKLNKWYKVAREIPEFPEENYKGIVLLTSLNPIGYDKGFAEGACFDGETRVFLKTDFKQEVRRPINLDKMLINIIEKYF